MYFIDTRGHDFVPFQAAAQVANDSQNSGSLTTPVSDAQPGVSNILKSFSFWTDI